MRHTPGPWNWHKMTGEWPTVFCDKGLCADRPIAQVFGPNAGNQAENTAKANATLIAAAPEMLEALKVLLANRELGEYESQKQGLPRMIEANDLARQAIAKAEGRNP